MRTLILFSCFGLSYFAFGADDNIPITFTDLQVKAGDRVYESGDSAFGGNQDAIPNQWFELQNATNKKKYQIQAPLGFEANLMEEYVKQKKTLYIDVDAVGASITRELNNIQEKKSAFINKHKGLSNSDRNALSEATSLYDLEEPLRSKLISAYLKETTSPIPLRAQPIGSFLNFVYRKAAEGPNCSCVELNGTKINTCDGK